jgi:hypothetical protein
MTTAMLCRITVWTPVTDKDVAASTSLVRHLDSQTSAVSEWELVLATPGGGHVAALERMAARRPNVRVLVDDVDRAGAEGEWVLDLAADDRLEPTALSRLAALTSDAATEDVLVVRPERAGPDGTATPLVLTRRGSSGARRARGVEDERGAEVVVPVPLRGRRAPWAPDPAKVAPDVTARARWVDGMLELDGRAPLHAGGAARAELVLVGRHHHTVRSVPVDAFTVSGDDEDTEPGLEWSARIGVTPDDVDDELEVWLQVEPTDTDDEEGEGATASHRSPLVGRVGAPAGLATEAPAVIDGRLVCARTDQDALVIDVGATGRSLLGPLDPRQTSVVEDATGSLLTIRLPQVAHHGHPRVVRGALLLDGHPLPARLVVDDEPRVECRLAGLPGSAVLECSFGRGPAAATGCAVLVSLTGEFTVVARRSSDLSAVADDERPGTRPRASGPVAALRRHLPHVVDPVVSKLSKVPAFRVAYRRVTGLR